MSFLFIDMNGLITMTTLEALALSSQHVPVVPKVERRYVKIEVQRHSSVRSTYSFTVCSTDDVDQSIGLALSSGEFRQQIVETDVVERFSYMSYVSYDSHLGLKHSYCLSVTRRPYQNFHQVDKMIGQLIAGTFGLTTNDVLWGLRVTK